MSWILYQHDGYLTGEVLKKLFMKYNAEITHNVLQEKLIEFIVTPYNRIAVNYHVKYFQRFPNLV
jgi:hypothetical protein